MCQYWKAASQVCIATDACVASTVTHADRLVMPGHKTLITWKYQCGQSVKHLPAV